MRTITKSALLVLMMMLMTVGLCFAGGMNHRNTISYVCYGTPFTYTGTVISMTPGQGMDLATEDGNVKIYGIGPTSYWVNTIGIEKPEVGEEVTVEGYTVDFNGVSRNIAMSVTIGDQTVQLRDGETCFPLWRKFPHNQ